MNKTELKNIVERMIVLSSGEMLTLDQVPDEDDSERGVGEMERAVGVRLEDGDGVVDLDDVGEDAEQANVVVVQAVFEPGLLFCPGEDRRIQGTQCVDAA